MKGFCILARVYFVFHIISECRICVKIVKFGLDVHINTRMTITHRRPCLFLFCGAEVS